ncbi:fibronectin type III domain-containing protein, partial [Actinomadura sp. LCR2-06]|nr:fibronectin type III domain-containing protein [Actinomadura violacea]
PTPTPTSGGQEYDFTLAGETFVKAPNGKAPLTGSVNANLNLDTGDVTADLKLNPTKGNFQILGFLPVTADIGLVSQGQTTGLYKDGQLTTNSKVITKLSTFNVFGAIPIGGGDQCQTTKPSDITLKSADGQFFDPGVGGKISGTYSLSSIDNCGPLTGILSLFTAGDGNTIDLNLTPKA